MKTSDSVSFVRVISRDESQNKAHFNLLSLGENETDYSAENIFFPQMKTPRKAHICLHLFFIPFDIMYCYAKQC